MVPRFGVLDFHPIQYHTPLYQRLTNRAKVDLDVLFLSDEGYRPVMDEGFGLHVAWDIDLLSGYKHRFLAAQDMHTSVHSQIRMLKHWIRGHDVVVVHGHVNPWMLTAVAICRTHRIPYLLRGESHAQGQSAGLRRHLRNIVANSVVSNCAAGLAIGKLNDQFYRKYGAPKVIWAPYSVDDTRFAAEPRISRIELLERWNLDGQRKVIMFCGKLIHRKRPLDVAAAVRRLPREVNTIFVGEGELANDVRSSLCASSGVVTGFVNQLDLPAYLHAADILILPSEVETWGVVVNEAMASGTLPVVSDRVGSAPDLVTGVGEVYPHGNITALVAALSRALAKIDDPATLDNVRRRVAQYGLDQTADGFERAAFACVDSTSAR